MGLENLSLVLYDDLAWFEEMVTTVADCIIGTLSRVLETGGQFDACFMWEDMCYNAGPLLSPQHFKQLLVPHYRRITDLLHKYGVDVVGFDEFLVTQRFLIPKTDLVLIDEIGKMECFSEKFLSLVMAILDSEIPVVATISRKGGGFISEVKARTDVALMELTLENRESMLAGVLNELHSFRDSSSV